MIVGEFYEKVVRLSRNQRNAKRIRPRDQGTYR